MRNKIISTAEGVTVLSCWTEISLYNNINVTSMSLISIGTWPLLDCCVCIFSLHFFLFLCIYLFAVFLEPCDTRWIKITKRRSNRAIISDNGASCMTRSREKPQTLRTALSGCTQWVCVSPLAVRKSSNSSVAQSAGINRDRQQNIS